MARQKPVEVGDVMWVFDPTHHDDPLKWRLATVIAIHPPTQTVKTRTSSQWQALVSAKVAWQDGSVSSGHHVHAMRYTDSASTPYVQL